MNSSVASPIYQEGQRERIFPIFPRFPSFSSFFSFFPLFLAFFFAIKKGTLPPLDPPVATPLAVKYLDNVNWSQLVWKL